ncbi:sodium:solute symporter family protein [Lawsonibacter sp. LCP25S3_G6]|uniref:sodium:solute symporter family protein n=1 Tax=unclassified Lawsonibacter TaxID=2617946 RepID=UPI003F9E1C88
MAIDSGMLTMIAVVMGIYFVFMIGISWMGRKHGRTFDEAITAGRNCGVFMIIGSAVGSHIGNGFVVGGAASGAATGISGAWYGLGCAISYLVMAVTINRVVYRAGYISLPEFLQARYGEKMTSVIFSVTTALSYIANIAAQLMAGKALFEALGFNGTFGVWVICAVVIAYSMISGLWGAAATSVAQVAIIIVSLVITTVILVSQGAVGVVNDAVQTGQVPSTYWDIGLPGISAILITCIPISLAALCEQCTVQRIVSAKSEKVAFWGLILSFVIMIPAALMPAFIGMYGNVLYNDTTNSVFFRVALEVLPPLAAALLIAAVVAAIMSTIDTMLVAFSTIVLHNIYRGMINPNVSEKTLKKGDFIVHLCLGVVSAFVALQFTSILDLLWQMYNFCAACCFAPFIGGLFWKGATAKGAIASAITGFIYIALNMMGIIPTTTILSMFSFLPAAVAFVIVSTIDNKKNTIAT